MKQEDNLSVKPLVGTGQALVKADRECQTYSVVDYNAERVPFENFEITGDFKESIFFRGNMLFRTGQGNFYAQCSSILIHRGEIVPVRATDSTESNTQTWTYRFNYGNGVKIIVTASTGQYDPLDLENKSEVTLLTSDMDLTIIS